MCFETSIFVTYPEQEQLWKSNMTQMVISACQERKTGEKLEVEEIKGKFCKFHIYDWF